MAAGGPEREPLGWRPSQVTALERMPPLGPLYRRALTRTVLAGFLGRAPVADGRFGHAGPGMALSITGVAVERDRLAAYDRVCGFRIRDELPPTYPHVVAFPMIMALMTTRDFPLPALGLVHIGQEIEVRRALLTGEVLDIVTWVGPPRHHERGQRLEVLTSISVGGEDRWLARSTYLRPAAEPTGSVVAAVAAGRSPSRTSSRAGGATPQPLGASRRDSALAEPSAIWRIGARDGRDYAEVSGDMNPIHSHRSAARARGHRAPVAHNHWLLARCLATFDGRFPAAYVVRTDFTAAAPLSTWVGLTTSRSADDAGWRIALHGVRSRRQHLVGEVTWPPGGGPG